MKKILCVCGILSALTLINNQATVNALENEINVESNWNLTRTTFENSSGGIVLKQTEMGVPDNHAIAIYEVPFTDTTNFEITFKMTMDEFVASGRSANDVWAGIGFMGKPTFINWRNSESSGWAKDTPGLFTRFFNYSGDVRYSIDVYQENYHRLGEESQESDIVDTWNLGSGNADCTMKQDITYALKYETKDGKSFYNLYINGECITTEGEASFVEKDVVFADNKLFLLIAMNTQKDELNSLSKFEIKSINGKSVAVEGENNSNEDNTGNNNSGNTNSNKSGCKGSIGTSFGVLSALCILSLLKRKAK